MRCFTIDITCCAGSAQILRVASPQTSHPAFIQIMHHMMLYFTTHTQQNTSVHYRHKYSTRSVNIFKGLRRASGVNQVSGDNESGQICKCGIPDDSEEQSLTQHISTSSFRGNNRECNGLIAQRYFNYYQDDYDGFFTDERKRGQESSTTWIDINEDHAERYSYSAARSIHIDVGRRCAVRCL